MAFEPSPYNETVKIGLMSQNLRLENDFYVNVKSKLKLFKRISLKFSTSKPNSKKDLLI
jgi:hypothetical protein